MDDRDERVIIMLLVQASRLTKDKKTKQSRGRCRAAKDPLSSQKIEESIG
jgi:hypothetical protein